MPRIVGSNDNLNQLVEEVLTIFRYYASVREDYLHSDFDEYELHKVLAFRDAIHHSNSLENVEQILKMPVHEASLKGFALLALEKIGISGLSDDLGKVLKQFDKNLLSGVVPRQEFLPPGFRIIEEKAQTKQPDDIV